jgi:hypothetical protein
MKDSEVEAVARAMVAQMVFNEAVVDAIAEITCALPDGTPLYHINDALAKIRAALSALDQARKP